MCQVRVFAANEAEAETGDENGEDGTGEHEEPSSDYCHDYHHLSCCHLMRDFLRLFGVHDQPPHHPVLTMTMA